MDGGSSSSHSSRPVTDANLGEGVMHISRTFDVPFLAVVRENGVAKGNA